MTAFYLSCRTSQQMNYQFFIYKYLVVLDVFDQHY